MHCPAHRRRPRPATPDPSNPLPCPYSFFAGAGAIAALLRERGVELELIVDEGGVVQTDGLRPLLAQPAALVGTSEKARLRLLRRALGLTVLATPCRAVPWGTCRQAQIYQSSPKPRLLGTEARAGTKPSLPCPLPPCPTGL